MRRLIVIVMRRLIVIVGVLLDLVVRAQPFTQIGSVPAPQVLPSYIARSPVVSLPSFFSTNAVGTLSVDVLVMEPPWFNFRYWAAMGTHPVDGWVNPNLMCSTDGYNWKGSPGLPTPIVTNKGATEGEGPSLLLLTNNTLMMYTITGVGPQLHWRNFSNPSTFSEGDLPIFTNASVAPSGIKSPQAIQGPGNRVQLWATVADSNFDVTNVVYFSSDSSGTNFGTWTYCTGLTNGAGWKCCRPRVRYQGGIYYCLATQPSTAAGEMHAGPISYFTSANGTNWTLIADNVLTPRDFPTAALSSATEAPQFWVASFSVRNSTAPPVFDIWATTANDVLPHLVCAYFGYTPPQPRPTYIADYPLIQSAYTVGWAPSVDNVFGNWVLSESLSAGVLGQLGNAIPWGRGWTNIVFQAFIRSGQNTNSSFLLLTSTQTGATAGGDHIVQSQFSISTNGTLCSVTNFFVDDGAARALKTGFYKDGGYTAVTNQIWIEHAQVLGY